MHQLAVASVITLSLILAACGGGRSSSTTPGGTGGPEPPPSPASGAVTVAAGSTVNNVNITLPAPSGSGGFNAEMLGVAVPATSGSTSIQLTNSPSIIHLGQLPSSGQMIVAITGTGLATTATPPTSLVTSITVSGPNDVTVGQSNVLSGGGGIGFRITLGASTATGARTIFLKNAQGDITAFSGGLEILP